MNENQQGYLFGLEWAPELELDILGAIGPESCVELIPENFFKGRYSAFLKALREKGTPVAVHGVQLSIGSMEPLNESHLDKMLEVADQVNMINFSEHLALTAVENVVLDALTPLAWNQEVADEVCRKIDKVQSRLKVPFLIENVSNRFVIPQSDYSETEFINLILERTGCGLLLDVTNVYTNSVNFKFDPYEWIDQIRLDRVGLVHLAGGYRDPDGFLMDSHDNAVPQEAWDLYRYASKRVSLFITVIERTGNFPNFHSLRAELAFAESVIEDRALVAGGKA